MAGFTKITPVNGFDNTNVNNAKQNSCVWAMAEMGEYLYVGTGRNTIYSLIKSGQFGDLRAPEVFVPDSVDMRAEIWRYRKDGSGEWERVFKEGTPPDSSVGIADFRVMLLYLTHTGPNAGEALYACGATFAGQNVILKSDDGVNWRRIDAAFIAGDSTRAVGEHRGKLYLGTMEAPDGGGRTLLYCSDDPEEGCRQIIIDGDPTRNPRGEITSMVSFRGRLYVGTALTGGFKVWRTKGEEPAVDDWELVVDKGAGDALNEIAASMEVFGEHIYVGTAICCGVSGLERQRRFVPPKGFDLIRINADDSWEVIVGGAGQRDQGLYQSGFGEIFNAYCWQLKSCGEMLYLGTWDWSVLLPPLIASFFTVNGKWVLDMVKWLGNPANYSPELLSYPIANALQSALASLVISPLSMGCDLYRSQDGVEWEIVFVNGLGNACNYGVSSLLAGADGTLYLGTANPFQGCEVWVQKLREENVRK